MKYKALIVQNGATLLVVVFNVASRNMVEKLIESIGYHTKSLFTSVFFIVLFATSFLNTGVITILASANLSHAPYPLNKLPLSG